jgi:hypothetical protein
MILDTNARLHPAVSATSSAVTVHEWPYTSFISLARDIRKESSPAAGQYPKLPCEDEVSPRAFAKDSGGGYPGEPCDISSKGRSGVGTYDAAHLNACGILDPPLIYI